MMLRLLSTLALLLATSIALAGSADECGLEAKPCVKYGARVFAERCTLCHGSDGLGEGILSLAIKDYPNTNLLRPKHKNHGHNIKDIVTMGGGLNDVDIEMPPWGDELTATQLDSVVQFVKLLRTDLEKALPLLKIASKEVKPSKRIGRGVFRGRCSLCHGKFGLGDGKMSRIIKNPPPFNLTLSRQTDEYLHQIISKGGGAMGRSPRMPPFGDDLSETEIRSVILHIKSLRTPD